MVEGCKCGRSIKVGFKKEAKIFQVFRKTLFGLHDKNVEPKEGVKTKVLSTSARTARTARLLIFCSRKRNGLAFQLPRVTVSLILSRVKIICG
jgi:hypothetical protein